jgi:hypothetical protein
LMVAARNIAASSKNASRWMMRFAARKCDSLHRRVVHHCRRGFGQGAMTRNIIKPALSRGEL